MQEARRWRRIRDLYQEVQVCRIALRPGLETPNFDKTQMASPAGTLSRLHPQQVNFLSSSPGVGWKRRMGEAM